MRKCHLTNPPVRVGIATQDPVLRKRFQGHALKTSSTSSSSSTRKCARSQWASMGVRPKLDEIRWPLRSPEPSRDLNRAPSGRRMGWTSPRYSTARMPSQKRSAGTQAARNIRSTTCLDRRLIRGRQCPPHGIAPGRSKSRLPVRNIGSHRGPPCLSGEIAKRLRPLGACVTNDQGPPHGCTAGHLPFGASFPGAGRDSSSSSGDRQRLCGQGAFGGGRHRHPSIRGIRGSCRKDSISSALRCSTGDRG